MRTVRVLAALALLVWAPCTLAAQRGRAEVAEGNRLFAEERYGEARERYLDALRKDPNSPVIRFNEGNALYQTQALQQALEAYQQAVIAEDPALQAKAWYNLGNVLYRQQQLQESLEAYKQALKLDPRDADAKHNLEAVLKQLEQQPPQQNADQSNQEDRPDENQPSPPPPSTGEQDDDREQPPPSPEPNEPSDDQSPPPAGAPPPPSPEMSREQAERLLQAIREDPNEVKRKVPATRRQSRSKKDW